MVPVIFSTFLVVRGLHSARNIIPDDQAPQTSLLSGLHEPGVTWRLYLDRMPGGYTHARIREENTAAELARVAREGTPLVARTVRSA
jgi:hypothetical protein